MGDIDHVVVVSFSGLFNHENVYIICVRLYPWVSMWYLFCLFVCLFYGYLTFLLFSIVLLHLSTLIFFYHYI